MPFTLGRDFAGIVDQVGEVKDWRPGDEVAGFVGQGQGALAEFVLVDASALARRPSNVDWVTAGAVPLAALTAWQGLFDQGNLQKGECVLIHAGAGGVGHFAVQFARYKGAEVLATASADAVGFVESLGATRVIDYHKEQFETVAQDMDLVLDLIGGDTQERSWTVVKPGGTLISTLTEPSAREAAFHGAHAARYTARPDGAQLAMIMSLIEKGGVKVNVVDTFAFDEVPNALARLAKGHLLGKIVVTMRE